MHASIFLKEVLSDFQESGMPEPPPRVVIEDSVTYEESNSTQSKSQLPSDAAELPEQKLATAPVFAIRLSSAALPM